ncbi:unnamed protein product [Caenorhabditis sp. 36 PRJEB53466]|nr:unnamed protein product [Caenorhabditis sp. 36 PRJEB53466]
MDWFMLAFTTTILTFILVRVLRVLAPGRTRRPRSSTPVESSSEMRKLMEMQMQMLEMNRKQWSEIQTFNRQILSSQNNALPEEKRSNTPESTARDLVKTSKYSTPNRSASLENSSDSANKSSTTEHGMQTEDVFVRCRTPICDPSDMPQLEQYGSAPFDYEFGARLPQPSFFANYPLPARPDSQTPADSLVAMLKENNLPWEWCRTFDNKSCASLAQQEKNEIIGQWMQDVQKCEEIVQLLNQKMVLIAAENHLEVSAAVEKTMKLGRMVDDLIRDTKKEKTVNEESSIASEIAELAMKMNPQCVRKIRDIIKSYDPNGTLTTRNPELENKVQLQQSGQSAHWLQLQQQWDL